MTNSKKRIIIMAAAVLVTLTALLLLVIDWSACSRGEDSSHADHVHTDTEHELLIDRRSDELESMTLTNTEGTFTLRRDEQSGLIEIAELEGIPQNSEFIEMVWYYALTIGYGSKLEITEDVNLADFGLDSPAVTVKNTYYDGTTTGFRVGSLVAGSENNYYFLVDGYDGYIYVTELDFAFFQGNRYWVSDDVFGYRTQSEAPEIGTITISGSSMGGTYVFTPGSSKDKSDIWYGCDYIITSPDTCAADSYNMSLLLDELSCLVANEAVCVRPTEAQLAEYGLTSPDAVITHQRGGKDITIRLSKANFDYLYMKVDGIDVVYQLLSDSFPMMASLDIDLLRSAYPHTRYFETISSLTVATAQESYTFRIERVEKSEGLYEYFAYCGDAEISLTHFKNLLEVFNNATAVSYGETPTQDAPYLTVTFRYHESYGRGNTVIEYLPCANRRFVCRINGSASAVITSMWMDKFVSDARALASGGTVTP